MIALKCKKCKSNDIYLEHKQEVEGARIIKCYCGNCGIEGSLEKFDVEEVDLDTLVAQEIDSQTKGK